MSCTIFRSGVCFPPASLCFSTLTELMDDTGFKTKHFWLEYPHRKMTFQLKTYYLLQAAYWLQQTIILIAKIEKPRKDYNELVAHVSPSIG